MRVDKPVVTKKKEFIFSQTIKKYVIVIVNFYQYLIFYAGLVWLSG